MKLEGLYRQVSERISSLDLESIWPGFSPLRFALYDEEACFFNGTNIEKTDAFCANTSIVYQGEPIAIWKVDGEPDISVLTAKIVHEMFHAHQIGRGWDCWADEMDALYRYEYDTENLALRLRENELLFSLAEHFDEAALRELLSHRKRRSEEHPYEFSYESKIEEIEGSATYVEWMVLQQLDERAAAAMTERMRAAVTQPEALFPIRISCYYTGALMIRALLAAGVYSFTPPERPAVFSVLRSVSPSDGGFPGRDVCRQRISDALADFHKDTETIVRSALERNEVVLDGPAELLGVNIFDARFYRGYMISRYFLQYRDGQGTHTLHGNYVVRMANETAISRVYLWE